MATLSPPTITTTPILLNTPKTPQLSSFKKRTHHLRSACGKISCKSNNNNENNDHLYQNPNKPFLLDRRNVLLGLGGMYGTTLTLGGQPPNTLAEPIAPDVSACTLTNAAWDGSAGSVGDHCCPPKFPDLEKIKVFIPDEKQTAGRIRRPAHKAMQDPVWLADYKKATAIMKSLPLSDPRSFMQQARVHCAYCDGSYPVLGHQDQRLEVHAGWLFAPFHRWYLYFFEKILGKLIDKPDFALPYWNWDHPDGMRIPEMFKDVESPLYDPNRNEKHLNKIIDLSYNPPTDNPQFEHEYSDEKQIKENLLLMRKQMLYVTKPKLFFGAPYRSGMEISHSDNAPVTAGALETAPHNMVHAWTGSNTVRGGQDMGAFWSAGRDSIFYCHHANVDRMWSVWRNELPGRSRLDITDDSDYLNAYFIFYDENAEPVKVYVKDSFDTDKLGYNYEQQDLPWLSKTSIQVSTPPSSGVDAVKFPMPLDKSVIKTKVARPRKGRNKREKEEEEEVIVINFLYGTAKEKTKFDVYVNDDYDHKSAEKTQVNPNYAGSFTSLMNRGAHSGEGMSMGGNKPKKGGVTLAITNMLDDIGASNDDFIQVTIVPKSGTEGIVITDVKIDYVS